MWDKIARHRVRRFAILRKEKIPILLNIKLREKRIFKLLLLFAVNRIKINYYLPVLR